MSAKPFILSVIGEGSRFVGDIDIDQGIVHINGDFKGTIKADGDVAVGITGRTQCNIDARNIIINGMVKGNIRGSESIRINSTSIVLGSLEAANIVMESGVIFNGVVHTTDALPLEETKRTDDNTEKNSKAESSEKSTNNTDKKEYNVWKK